MDLVERVTYADALDSVITAFFTPTLAEKRSNAEWTEYCQYASYWSGVRSTVGVVASVLERSNGLTELPRQDAELIRICIDHLFIQLRGQMDHLWRCMLFQCSVLSAWESKGARLGAYLDNVDPNSRLRDALESKLLLRPLMQHEPFLRWVRTVRDNHIHHGKKASIRRVGIQTLIPTTVYQGMNRLPAWTRSEEGDDVVVEALLAYVLASYAHFSFAMALPVFRSTDWTRRLGSAPGYIHTVIFASADFAKAFLNLAARYAPHLGYEQLGLQASSNVLPREADTSEWQMLTAGSGAVISALFDRAPLLEALLDTTFDIQWVRRDDSAPAIPPPHPARTDSDKGS